jgi:hypothetical protein
MKVLLIFLTTFLLVVPAQAEYSGGTGVPNDLYRIATAEDLILLGQSAGDHGKHFILTADIDLNPNLPGRKIFDKAVITADTSLGNFGFQGIPFTGVFDGNNHTITHLTISGESYQGLFGKLASGAEVKDLSVVNVNITGSSNFIGGLAGNNRGTVTRCYISGTVFGEYGAGRLGGYNWAIAIQCYSTCTVSGTSSVGGLVGIGDPSFVKNSFWDMETSGLSFSPAGVGLTTAEMMDPEILGLQCKAPTKPNKHHNTSTGETYVRILNPITHRKL